MTRRILLADDDEDDRTLFAEVFSDFASADFELNCVVNGEEVLSYLRHIGDTPHLPDLIVLDQNMPLRNGRETVDIILTTEQFRKIPLVIYSTYNDPGFIADCLSSGVKAVLSKPDSWEGYVEMVRQLIRYTEKS